MNSRPKMQQKIETRILQLEDGSAFTASDFMDIADTDAVNKALSRLTENGTIRRVIQGVYDKPEYSALLKAYGTPRVDMVATALARKFNWTIAPAGDAALNLLHLSTQVPNHWEYVSDGPARRYEFNGTTLTFRTIKQREIAGFHTITVMVIQALRAIGKEQVSNRDIRILRKELSDENKDIIRREARTVAAWILRIIKEVCEEESA